ncbi:MAG: 1-deoxy-D-xylulose-5-phosphate reductoisomerase [Bacilli bacterium]|jgi:1-deoxy-D-xylulose-5-phosphate reductoisomerase|nr:1-deoxy-D-xylulose-5-phosphate reductoisomerase [Acholeplasmataceae bacterium]
MKNVCLLGATGSIGQQVLEVMEQKPLEYKLISIAFGENVESAKKIIEKFNPTFVSAKSKEIANLLKAKYPEIEVGYGNEGIIKAATFEAENPLVINSLVGSVGLLPTVKAIEAGRKILLANKETLVMAGDIISSLAKKHDVSLIPIDSEHSAIFQILLGKNKEDVKRLILTASGGPFRKNKREDLKNVTVNDALNHPNWKMGAKITIDSATMMNKGFEVIEAKYLFDMDLDQIDVIIHPQSIVHSMVEFKDHSILAQLGVSDMRLPIQFALSYPHHETLSLVKPLVLEEVGTLEFEKLDDERFPLVKIAKEAVNKGGLYPAVLNASNEAAVNLFLNGKIAFSKIEEIILEELNQVPSIYNPNLDDILNTDIQIKEKINRKFNR